MPAEDIQEHTDAPAKENVAVAGQIPEIAVNPVEAQYVLAGQGLQLL